MWFFRRAATSRHAETRTLATSGKDKEVPSTCHTCRYIYMYMYMYVYIYTVIYDIYMIYDEINLYHSNIYIVLSRV